MHNIICNVTQTASAWKLGQLEAQQFRRIEKKKESEN